jgi:predicted transcriptional regulator
VVCVRSNDLAVDAYYTIFRNGVSAAGVVDETGKLVGCLSSSDLKQIAEDYDFTQLLKPVKDYLGEDATDPIALHEFDTLADVIAKLVTQHVHRVFIVGPGGFPQGIVTTTDAIRMFVSEETDDKKKKEKKDKKKEEKKKDEKKDKKKDDKKKDGKKKDGKKKDKKKDKKKK